MFPHSFLQFFRSYLKILRFLQNFIKMFQKLIQSHEYLVKYSTNFMLNFFNIFSTPNFSEIRRKIGKNLYFIFESFLNFHKIVLRYFKFFPNRSNTFSKFSIVFPISLLSEIFKNYSENSLKLGSYFP